MHCLTGTVLPSTIICLVDLHDSPGWQEQSSPCGRENKPQSKLIRTGVAKPIHTNQCATTAILDLRKYPNEKSKQIIVSGLKRGKAEVFKLRLLTFLFFLEEEANS